MSIATRIEDIEQHLTNDYAVLTLAGADLTGVNKNILNLKPTWKERLLYFMNNGTQVVWNNWDKVSGTGTSLTLNNTEEAPMSLVYKGNTSQSGTPTPSSPIPVQVVSGDNSIKVEGKNLIPITYAKIKSSNTSGSWNNNVYSYNGLTFTVNEDLSVVINGTASGNTALNLIGTTNLFVDINISNGNYVLSGSTGGKQDMSTWGIYMAVKHSDNTTETQFCYNGDLAFTKIEGDTFFPVIRIGSGTICNNIEIKPMIRKSGTNSTYKPYKGASYPISLGNKELCKIGTYQDKIDKSTGKNLFDKNTNITQNTGLTSQGGTFSSTTYCVKEYLKVEANTTYTLHDNSSSNTKRVCFYTGQEESSFISVSEVVSNKKITFTTPTNCQYIRIQINQTELDNEMLNEGSTALPYEPYGTNWYLKKETGKVILDGSENWYQWGADTFYITRLSTIRTGLSNYYKYNTTVTGASQLSNGEFFIHDNTNNNVVIFRNTSITTVADFKTWLGTHNTEVLYVLDTPTYETITDTTLLSQLEALKKSYENVTNISQVNNDLPFELDVTALEEMN